MSRVEHSDEFKRRGSAIAERAGSSHWTPASESVSFSGRLGGEGGGEEGGNILTGALQQAQAGQRRHSAVSFVPSAYETPSGTAAAPSGGERRRLQRTPTPYYEEPSDDATTEQEKVFDEKDEATSIAEAEVTKSEPRPTKDSGSDEEDTGIRFRPVDPAPSLNWCYSSKLFQSLKKVILYSNSK